MVDCSYINWYNLGCKWVGFVFVCVSNTIATVRLVVVKRQLGQPKEMFKISQISQSNSTEQTVSLSPLHFVLKGANITATINSRKMLTRNQFAADNVLSSAGNLVKVGGKGQVKCRVQNSLTT